MKKHKIYYEDALEIIYNEIERQRNKKYWYRDMEIGNKRACDNIENRIHTKLRRLKLKPPKNK